MPEQLPTPCSFADKVQMLDAALTGKYAQDVAHTWRDNAPLHEPVNWYLHHDAYYLSDGGYSRLLWNPHHSSLFLTSNSRPEVKRRWADCKELVTDVEAEIINAMTEAGAGP